MKIQIIPVVPTSEFSEQFVQGMYDRMAVSFFKYGAVADAYPEKVDAVASLKLRLDKYIAIGNTEFLMDVANFAMIEFMRPRVHGAYFKPTDSGAPGRVWTNGEQSQRANNSDPLSTHIYKHEGD